jgi:hypothetical protein
MDAVTKVNGLWTDNTDSVMNFGLTILTIPGCFPVDKNMEPALFNSLMGPSI